VVALNLGGIIRLTYTVKDDTGALTNPSAATLTITQPDGTLAAGIVVDITPAETGRLIYDFTPTQAGLHSVRWATTGPTTAEDDVFVAESPASLLISVDEALDHLNATQVITGTVSRERLQRICLAASSQVERELDRTVVPRTFTETYSGVRGPIQLRHTPVISITSVTVGGSLLAGSQYLADEEFLYFGSTTGYSAWTAGLYNVVVTYRAGFAIPPQEIRDRALDIVQARWQSSQQSAHPVFDESMEGGVPVGGPMPAMSDAFRSHKRFAVA
jgi:hypothetical protein